MSTPTNYILSPWQMLTAQWRIIVALMLHDIRSRFGGNPLGFLMMGVGWPLSHILILILINSSFHGVAPYGDSAALWYATGVVPFMAFQYTSRFISLGLVSNRSLLSFPAVKIMDIMLARALIEILNAGLVILIVCGIFYALNIDFMPRDITQATLALLSMILLGVGFGIINGLIAGAFIFWVTGYALLVLVFWIASGIVFIPDALPEAARVPLSYFPPLQGVEWMRSAYYEGFGAVVLDKQYLVWWGVGSVAAGLLLERLLRGKMMR